MNKRYEALLGLYEPEQLKAMHRIKDALLDDPTALDNRASGADAVIAAGAEGTPAKFTNLASLGSFD